MKKLTHELHAMLVLLLCITFRLCAQNDVIVNVQVIPPYSPYLSTYIDQPNKLKLTLQNTTSQQKQLKLFVKIEGDNGVSGRTNASFKPASPIVLNPNEFKMIDFSSNETRNYFDPNRIDVTGITKAQVIQNQALPEGNYTICVRALDYNTNQPLSQAEPLGCSPTFPLFYIDPPMPIQPTCGNEVSANTPQNVIFSWTPPATAPGNIRYEFTLKEVPSSMPNHFDVIKNPAFPVLYSTIINAATTLVYTNNLPQLLAGKKYVWRLRSIDPANKVQFKNQGYSDACVFSYKGTSVSTQNAVQIPQQTTVPQLDFKLPSLTIKGKLQWAFRKVEEQNTPSNNFALTINLANQNTYADVVNGFEVNAGNVQMSLGGNQSQQGNANQQAGGNMNGGFFFQGNYNPAPPGGGVMNFATPKPSQFQITQNKIDALAGSKKYPLQKIQVKLVLKPKQEVLNNWKNQPKVDGKYAPPIPQPVVVGTAYTNNDGEFSVTCFNEVAVGFYELHLEIGTPHFIFSDVNIPLQQVQQSNVYSIGTLTGLAKTFRIQVKNFEHVYDKGKNTFTKGSEIKDVDVLAYHPMSWNYTQHPNQTKEGLRMDMGIDNNVSNKNVAKTKGSQQIPRLFANTANGGHIIIEAESPNYNKYKAALNVNAQSYPSLFENYLDKEVPVVLVENFLVGSDPVLKGKVLVEGLNTPVKGATVKLLKEVLFGFGPYKIAKTNDNGEFEIQGIKPDDKAYRIEISHGSLNAFKEDITLNKAGTVVEKNFYVKGQLIFVTGTVKDEDGNLMKDALVMWKSGGTPSFTNAEGKFLLSNIKGKHILLAKKPGFKDTEIEVEVKEPQGGGNMININEINNQANQQGVNNMLQNMNMQMGGGNILNGVQQQGGSNPQVQQQLPPGNPPMQLNLIAWNVGTVTLKRFYLKLKVADHDNNNPIANAKIEFNGSPVGSTNSNGEVILNNVTASADYGLVVYGPQGSSYVASAHNIVVDASKDTSMLTVKLKKGLKVSGKVTAAGSNVKQANIYVEGSEYLKTETDDEGNYAFALPNGEHTLWATKSGFVGDSKKQNFTSGDYTINFNLKDAGFDASKILGFDVQLTESKDLGNNEFEVSGSFVNIPSNAVFKSNPALKLDFTKQKVKVANGKASPSSGEIQTDVSQLPVELWTYIKLKLTTPSGLKVKPQQGDNTKGKIEGEMEVDIANTFAGLTGIEIPVGGFKLQYQNVSVVPAFTSDGSLPFSDTKLKVGTGDKKWKVHGLTLTLDAANTFVSKEGIDVKGALSTDGFKFLSGMTLNIQQMTIATSGDIKNLKVNMNPKPTINIQSWELGMSNIDISSQGLKLSGAVKMAFAGTNLNVDFTNLNLTKASLSGGTFSISNSGLPLFSFLKAEKNGQQGLTLQLLPDGKNFNLSGNVNFNFNKLLKVPFKVDEFGISTTGNIVAKINTDKSVGILDIATLKIKTLGINTAQKQVDLGGGIVLGIGNFAAEAATKLKYNPSGVTLEDFAFALSLGGIGNFGASASFNTVQERFAGSGKLGIASSPLEFSAGFVYSKVEFGADFNMGPSVKVPCGAVNLDKIGGGFNFNKAQNKFKVWGQTRIAFAADPSAAVNLDPTTFSVEVKAGGPVIEVSGQGNVVGMAVGNAKFTLDIPARVASLAATAGASFNKIPGLSASGSMNINAEIGFGSSPYLFFGQAMNINVANLCNASGGIAVAVNYFVPASMASMYRIPQGKFTGISSWSISSMGIPKNKPKTFDLGVSTAKFWAYNDSEVSFFCQLNGLNAGFTLGSGWGAGAKFCFIRGIGCVEVEAGASGLLSGQLDAGGIKSASASLSGWAAASIGCCEEGCANRICWFGPAPCGGKACFKKTVGVSYQKGSGFKFDL